MRQRNHRIHFQRRFFGSFDAPWSERSWIDLFRKETQNPFSDWFGFKNPILDFLKETRPSIWMKTKTMHAYKGFWAFMSQSFLFAVWNIFIHQCHILVWVNRTLGCPGCQKAGSRTRLRRSQLQLRYGKKNTIPPSGTQGNRGLLHLNFLATLEIPCLGKRSITAQSEINWFKPRHWKQKSEDHDGKKAYRWRLGYLLPFLGYNYEWVAYSVTSS